MAWVMVEGGLYAYHPGVPGPFWLVHNEQGANSLSWLSCTHFRDFTGLSTTAPPDPPGLSTGTAAVPLAGAYSLRLQSSCDLLVLFAQLIIQTLTEKDATSK